MFFYEQRGELGYLCAASVFRCIAIHTLRITLLVLQKVVIWRSIGSPTCYFKLFTNYTRKIKTSADSQLQNRFLHEGEKERGKK